VVIFGPIAENLDLSGELGQLIRVLG